MTATLARTLLAKSGLLGGLSAAQLDTLAAKAQIRRIHKGEVLFAQGDSSDFLYILIEGSATLSIVSATGREVIVFIANPGDHFGEISLLDGGPRTATCTVRRAGRVLALRGDDLLAHLDEPRVARAVIMSICSVLRRTTDRVELLALRSLRARVAHSLLANALNGRGSPIPEVRMTQEEIALMSGAARPRVNQILRRLEEDGVIGKSGRVVLIRDPARLRDISTEAEDA